MEEESREKLRFWEPRGGIGSTTAAAGRAPRVKLGSCLGSKGSLQPGGRWVPEDSLASSGDCGQQSQQASSEPCATAGLWTSSAEHLKWVFNAPFACWVPHIGGDPGLLHSKGKLLAVGLLFVVWRLQEAAEHSLRATGAHLDQGKQRGVKLECRIKVRLNVTDHAERGTSEIDFKPFSEVVYVVLPMALLHTSPLHYSVVFRSPVKRFLQ